MSKKITQQEINDFFVAVVAKGLIDNGMMNIVGPDGFYAFRKDWFGVDFNYSGSNELPLGVTYSAIVDRYRIMKRVQQVIIDVEDSKIS